MSIEVNQEKKSFTLQTTHTTYQMIVHDSGSLLHTYYGEKIPAEDLSYLLFDGECHFAPYPYENTARKGSLDVLTQEFPTVGQGDSRAIALDVMHQDGTHVLDLRYSSFELIKGKYNLETFPSFYATKDENVESLKITLKDALPKLEITLYYAVFEKSDLITRTVKITNHGTQSIQIYKIQSLVLDFPTGDFDLLHFHGKWAMERQIESLALEHAKISFGSNYGLSGNKQNPGFVLAKKNASEFLGECYGFNLVYSGNFEATAQKASLGQSRITLGIGDDQFSWKLEPEQSFEAPEGVMSYSNQGFSKLSQNFHDAIRKNLCRSKFTQEKRPVLINNWEATYFDFTGEKLIEIARAAKPIGVDLFVMDDGWFGNRYDDNRALGDWTVNEEKLGMTLAELVESIHQLGLDFGIWMEPEMVNEDSDLYRAHPDWVLQFPHRKALLGRNQFVLNLARKEVVEYLYEKICQILDAAPISYLKWDMNRPLSDWYSKDLPADRQGELQTRYILGLYDILGRLTERYPDVLFEGCSSGGARFDLGMLAFHPQIWTSDNTDAINRLAIQYGTSFMYPISAMGTHVSVSPNHQNGRITPLKTRINVAMSGTFGYELDVSTLTCEEKKEAQLATKTYHTHQALIMTGDYYRIKEDRKISAWQVVAKDKKESLLTYVVKENEGNPEFIYITLKGLLKDAVYEISQKSYKGSVLMSAGLKLKQPKSNVDSEQIYIQKRD